jgi:hypothetical protein
MNNIHHHNRVDDNSVLRSCKKRQAPSVTANLKETALKMPDTISTHSSRSARPRENEARRFSNWKPVSRWLGEQSVA